MHREVSAQKWTLVSLQQLPAIGLELLKRFPDQKIWLFYGEMGAGKTTLIKKICEGLGVEDIMSSPTFTVVNEYLDQTGRKVFHFDFYRVKNELEAVEIGVDEYFYSGNYCFIEWPERIQSLLPTQHLAIEINAEDPEHRTIEVTINAH